MADALAKWCWRPGVVSGATGCIGRNRCGTIHAAGGHWRSLTKSIWKTPPLSRCCLTCAKHSLARSTFSSTTTPTACWRHLIRHGDTAGLRRVWFRPNKSTNISPSTRGFAHARIRQSAIWHAMQPGTALSTSAPTPPRTRRRVSSLPAKHAIESYSRSAARELGNGITVNVIAPGPIQTGYIPP